MTMKLWALPFSLGILAIISGNIAFIISANEGFIETCFPYLEGCASISKSGRHGLAAILFKLMVLPLMALLSVYWFISYNYIKKLTPSHSVKSSLMLTLGIIGSLFGILYTAFLGSEGDIYQLLRRFGIYLFFLGSYMAQVMEVIQLSKINYLKNLMPFKGMKFLSYLIGFIILISFPFFGLIDNDDWLENVLEWNITFLICFYFVLSSFLWRRTELKINLEFSRL